jgi:hypothetical protein
LGEVVKLGTLAEHINAEHRACGLALNSALEHALAAGDLLLQAKAECNPRTWLAWLEANFEGKPRTAQVYMQLAKRRDLVERAKAQSSAYLSIAGALRGLAPQAFGPEPVPGTVPLPPDQEAEERAKERETLRLLPLAEYALRTGNWMEPEGVKASPGAWGRALDRATEVRRQSIRNVVDVLAHELDILVDVAAPEAVGRYLAERPNDPDEAEARSSMLAELREGMAWLQRVLEEAEAARGREG